MHLGYHELRNMLSKFREEREKRKMAPPSSTPAGPPGGATGTPPSGPPPRAGGDYRPARGGDEYRDRGERSERGGGYERHSSSRFESVLGFMLTSFFAY